MASPHRFFNMYLTTTISISLVLLLVGVECVTLLSARTILHRVKEDVTMTTVLRQDADSTVVARVQAILDAVEYCSSYTYTSPEQALEEHIRSLGEDPSAFLGFNPLSASYEIHPTDAYSAPDSLALLAEQLEALPYVSEVLYPRDLADILSSNVHDFSLLLAGIALLLLLVSMVLIVNTIRLQIYAKRFLINTMTLVGATSWVIRRPFVRKNMLIGLLAAIAALAILGGLIYYVHYQMHMMIFPLTWQNITLVSTVVVLSGLLITLFASLIATGKYIRMDNNSLYEI